MNIRIRFAVVGLAALLSGCNVSTTNRSTGGASLDGATGSCPAGLTVLSSDYSSTDVSLLGTDGKVLSASVLSSGSTSAGVSTALSGDVVLPSRPVTSHRVVLLDRGSNVVTWIDPSSGSVLSQLKVGTGFNADPYDYIEMSETKAYVARYETNPTPGKEPFDSGDDLLVVDPSAFKVTGHVPLRKSDDGSFEPRADRLVRVGNQAWALLERLDASYAPAPAGRIAGVDPTTDQVAWTLDLPSAENCGGMTISPSGTRVAVSCSGDSAPGATAGRAIVLIDATTTPPKELRRFDAAVAALSGPPAPSLAFANETTLLGVAYGGTDGKVEDALFALDVDTGRSAKLLDGGGSFVLGDVQCLPGCTDRCFLADAHANGLRPFTIGTSGGVAGDAGVGVSLGATIPIDPTIGLPPRSIGLL